MKTESTDLDALLRAVESLRAEIAGLAERVAALESNATTPRAATAVAPPPGEPLRDELVAVIGAAVAAYLGKRAHVRQIRLLASPAWGQQGRVTIQASHKLAGRN